MKIPDKTAYGILEKYGIELAGYAFARNLKEGETASKKLSFPIVLKIDSPEIIHKSDSGCVQVAFSEAEFSGKFKLLMKNILSSMLIRLLSPENWTLSISKGISKGIFLMM